MRLFAGILVHWKNEETSVSSEIENPDQWAARILYSATPLMAATARATVTVEPPLDADVAALNEALNRVKSLLAHPSEDVNHDLLNLIGAIRGYGEMLYEDLELLHPALQSALPPLLSAAESKHAIASDEGEPLGLSTSQAPGVILAVVRRRCRCRHRCSHQNFVSQSLLSLLPLLSSLPA